MAIDTLVFARNLEVRLTALQGEMQKVRARLQRAEQRIYDLENDVSEAFEPSLSDAVEEERARAPARVANVVPIEQETPKFRLKRRFQGKFAVQNAAGDLLTADLPRDEAQVLCDAFLERGSADLKPHQVRDAG